MSLDIHCPHCGEPCDMGELHDVYDGFDKHVPYKQAVKVFIENGCGLWQGNRNLPDHFAKCTASIVDQEMADRAKIMMEFSEHPDEWLY